MSWGGADVIIIGIKSKINIMCLTHPQNHPPPPQPMQKLSSTKLVSGAKTIRDRFCRLCLTHSPPSLLIFINCCIPWSCIKRSHFLKTHKSANSKHLPELPFFRASFITWKNFRHLKKKTKSIMCLQLMLLTTCKNYY